MAGGNRGDQLQVKIKGNILSHPVAASALILRGCMVNVKATGFAALASDTGSETFAGMSEEGNTVAEAVANGTKNVRCRRRGIFKMKLTAGDAAAAPTLVGSLVYVHTPQSASVDELIGLTGSVNNHVLVGKIVKHGTDAQAIAGTSTADVWVDVMGAQHTVLGDATYNTKTSLAAHTTGAGAELVGVEDSKGFGTSKTVEDVLEAILTFGHIDIPLSAFRAGDGETLTIQATTEPGFAILNSQELVITYPDDGAASDLMFGGIAFPQDLDETAGIEIHFLVEKSGNNNSDTAVDLTAFVAGVGDSNNADIVDTTVITLTDVATTVEELVFSCNVDATNLLGPPASLSAILDYATAGTDELSIHAAWIEYTKKLG